MLLLQVLGEGIGMLFLDFMSRESEEFRKSLVNIILILLEVGFPSHHGGKEEFEEFFYI